MTKEEKERKIKLAILIMLVEYVKFRKQMVESPSIQSPINSMMFAHKQLYWLNQISIIQSTPTFESGGASFDMSDRECIKLPSEEVVINSREILTKEIKDQIKQGPLKPSDENIVNLKNNLFDNEPI